MGVGCTNHYWQHATCQKTDKSSYYCWFYHFQRADISVGLHPYDRLATIEVEDARTHYLYKFHLLWVWSGWIASIIIITDSMIQVLIQVNLLLPMRMRDQPYQAGVSLHMTTSHNRRYWNTLYIDKVDLLLVWSGWSASIITYSMIQVWNQVNLLLLTLTL